MRPYKAREAEYLLAIHMVAVLIYFRHLKKKKKGKRHKAVPLPVHVAVRAVPELWRIFAYNSGQLIPFYVALSYQS